MAENKVLRRKAENAQLLSLIHICWSRVRGDRNNGAAKPPLRKGRWHGKAVTEGSQTAHPFTIRGDPSAACGGSSPCAGEPLHFPQAAPATPQMCIRDSALHVEPDARRLRDDAVRVLGREVIVFVEARGVAAVLAEDAVPLAGHDQVPARCV